MVKTEPFDPARHLARPEAQEELLNDALASGNAAYVAHALGVIARARNEPRGPGSGCDPGSFVPRPERDRRSPLDHIARCRPGARRETHGPYRAERLILGGFARLTFGRKDLVVRF